MLGGLLDGSRMSPSFRERAGRGVRSGEYDKHLAENIRKNKRFQGSADEDEYFGATELGGGGENPMESMPAELSRERKRRYRGRTIGDLGAAEMDCDQGRDGCRRRRGGRRRGARDGRLEGPSVNVIYVSFYDEEFYRVTKCV